MKISFIHIYSKNSNFNDLINLIKKKKDLELIILNDSHWLNDEFEILRNKHAGEDRIKFESYPRVSRSFLYNRGISLATGDFIGVNGVNAEINDKYISRLNDVLKGDSFIFVDSGFAKALKKKDFLLTFHDFELSTSLQLLQSPFYLNKKLVKEFGLFFDENLEQVELLDVISRVFKYGLKISTFSQVFFAKISSRQFFDIGYNLFLTFDKYGKGSILLAKTVLKFLFKSPIATTLIFKGILSGFFRKFVVFNLFKLTRKFNRSLIEFCRRHKNINLLLYPAELMVEPTNLCNASCPLCPTGSKQLGRHKGFLSFKLFKKIVDDGKFYLESILLWNLGEPFLNKDIYSIIQYAKRHNIHIMSSSNGYAIRTPGSVNRLLESGIDRLIIGVDGVDQKTFSLYRKGLVYAKVLKGLKLVQKQKKVFKIDKPIIEFQMILMKQNSHQLDKAYALAKKLETEFRLKYVNLNMVSDEEKKKYLPEDSRSHVYKLINKKALFKEKKNNLPCVIWDGMVINWDGGVNPCIFDYYSKINLGNVEDTSLIKVWRGEMFKKLRKSVITHKASVTICKNCPINERYSELYII